MANKKVSQLTSKPSVLVTDLFPIADPSTGQLYKTTISDLGTAIGSGVSSVNGLVGAVVLDTDDIQELVSPTNKWFTDTRARAALSASSPLAYNSGTGVFSIPAATSSQNGYLTSTDWTTFNSKQAALSGTGFVKISGTTISYDNSTYLTTSAAASTYVPYTGANGAVNLGTNTLTFGTNSYVLNSSGGAQFNLDGADAYNTQLGLASGTVMKWLIGNSGQTDGNTFFIKKSTTYNSGTTAFTINYTTLDSTFFGKIIKDGGTSAQFLKADGSIDSSTYLTTGTAASTYLPLTGGTLTGKLTISASTMGAQINGGTFTQATSSSYALGVANGGGYDLTLGTSSTAGVIQTWSSKPLSLNPQGNNVGIGTTSPSTKLTIFGDWMNVTDGTVNVYFGSDGSGGQLGTVSNHYQRFVTNNTERMRITSAGKVFAGITTEVDYLTRMRVHYATDSSYLDVTSGGGDAALRLGGNYGQITNVTGQLYITCAGATGDMIFRTGSSTERMRITSDGHSLFGTTGTSWTNTAGFYVFYQSAVNITRNGAEAMTLNRLTSDGEILRFFRSGSQVGSVSVTTSLTSYNITSDYRLKQDLKPINGIDLVNKINVYNYEWKSDKTRMDGVLAHELAEVLPYAVTGVKDGEQMQSVDYSKIVPVMVQAIKDLKAELDTLKNK